MCSININAMDANKDNLKVLSLISLYKEFSDHDESQFISHLIGEHDLLKKMGKWFEKKPFTTLFKNEFEIGSREKALLELSQLNEHHIIEQYYIKYGSLGLKGTVKTGVTGGTGGGKNMKISNVISQFFWIRVRHHDNPDEQDIIFQKIMESKGYTISQTTCDLNYDNEYVMHYNNVEMSSQYPLAYGHINYEDAVIMSRQKKAGIEGGEVIVVEGYLASLFGPDK